MTTAHFYGLFCLLAYCGLVLAVIAGHMRRIAKALEEANELKKNPRKALY
jgi:hypothetical protein